MYLPPAFPNYVEKIDVCVFVPVVLPLPSVLLDVLEKQRARDVWYRKLL